MSRPAVTRIEVNVDNVEPVASAHGTPPAEVVAVTVTVVKGERKAVLGEQVKLSEAVFSLKATKEEVAKAEKVLADNAEPTAVTMYPRTAFSMEQVALSVFREWVGDDCPAEDLMRFQKALREATLNYVSEGPKP